MAECTPQALTTAAQCYQCNIAPSYQMAVQTYLLAQIANSLAGTTTDPNTLSTLASCMFCNLSAGMLLPVQVYLLCQIVDALD